VCEGERAKEGRDDEVKMRKVDKGRDGGSEGWRDIGMEGVIESERYKGTERKQRIWSPDK